jgi:hypothetical protein
MKAPQTGLVQDQKGSIQPKKESDGNSEVSKLPVLRGVVALFALARHKGDRVSQARPKEEEEESLGKFSIAVTILVDTARHRTFYPFAVICDQPRRSCFEGIAKKPFSLT